MIQALVQPAVWARPGGSAVARHGHNVCVLPGEATFWPLYGPAPLTVAAVMLVKRLYVQEVLGDETVSAPGANAAQATSERPAAALAGQRGSP